MVILATSYNSVKYKESVSEFVGKKIVLSVVEGKYYDKGEDFSSEGFQHGYFLSLSLQNKYAIALGFSN